MEKINKLHVGEKLYIPCKKNYVVLVHRIYTSYRVALYHRSDILGYSFFIKFKRRDVVLNKPEGCVDVIVNGRHVWMTNEEYHTYSLYTLCKRTEVNHDEELKAFKRQKSEERELENKNEKEQVSAFFKKMFKELPKDERRKFDDAEEFMLIMDEVKSRYLKAKEEDDSHLQVFYRTLTGDEKGKEASMNFARFAISTNSKVEKRKAEALELNTIRNRVMSIKAKACDGCYRKGKDCQFCKNCKKMMRQALEDIQRKEELEILRHTHGSEKTAEYEYIKDRILGFWDKKSKEYIPYSSLPAGSRTRWFLKGYDEAEKEAVVNFLIGQVMLMEEVFITDDIDDRIRRVKSWLATCKQYYLSGGYYGAVEKRDIIEQYFDEQIGLEMKHRTSTWVEVDASAVKDKNCNNLKTVEDVDGTVRYYQHINKDKYEFVDTTKMVFDMTHTEDGEEVDAIEQIADSYAHKVFDRTLYMEGLARAYNMYNHPYYEIVSSMEGIGRYSPVYAKRLLTEFYAQVVERGIAGDEINGGLRKRCRAERLNVKEAVKFYGIIASWAQAHKLGLV